MFIMSRVLICGDKNIATIETNIKTLPRIVNTKNFIAEYSLRPLPQIDMRKYMGINSSSQNIKNIIKSKEVNTPITDACKISSQTKYSLTLDFTDHDAKIAQNPRIPVKSISGALMPSIPS